MAENDDQINELHRKLASLIKRQNEFIVEIRVIRDELAALQAGVEVEVEGTPLKLGANINIKSVKVLGGSVTQTGTDTGPITTTGNSAFDGESTISSGISFSTPLASANYEVSSSFRDEYTFNDTASSGGSIGIPYTPLSY